jgi:putative copper resistance protein D
MAEALIVLRLIHFAAAMASFGVAGFRLYAFADEARVAGGPRAVFDRQLARLTLASAVLTLLSALAMVPCVAGSMAGSLASGFDPQVLEAVLLGTGFGHAWCLHLALAVLLVALAALPERYEFPGATATLALLVLASLGWVGHAAMEEGAAGIAHRLNQAVHLAAGGIWLGGLLPLGLLLRRATGPGGGAFQSLARTALPHFSQMGYAVVALVALTGMVNTALLVGSFDGLVDTPYGRLLLVKLALVAAMVAVALGNRFRLLPRVTGSMDRAPPLRALYRSVAVEQGLGLAILAVVAVLGTWPPALTR